MQSTLWQNRANQAVFILNPVRAQLVIQGALAKKRAGVNQFTQLSCPLLSAYPGTSAWVMEGQPGSYGSHPPKYLTTQQSPWPYDPWWLFRRVHNWVPVKNICESESGSEKQYCNDSVLHWISPTLLSLEEKRGLCFVLNLLDPKIDKCTATENNCDVFPYKKYQKASRALF